MRPVSGRSPDGSGSRPADRAASAGVSPVPASIPNALYRVPDGLRFDYRFSLRDGRERHDWNLIGEAGAIGIWAEPSSATTFDERWFGGVEVHHASQPDYLSERSRHDLCWLLMKPCWHDGSSLFFSENVEPGLPQPGEGPIGEEYVHRRVLHYLRDWFESHLASAIEAGTVETEGLDAQHESAVAKPDAPKVPHA
jgi:hypothetical protein